MRLVDLFDANLNWSEHTMIRVFDVEAVKPDLSPISVRAARVVYQDFVVSFFVGDLVMGSMG